MSKLEGFCWLWRATEGEREGYGWDGARRPCRPLSLMIRIVHAESEADQGKGGKGHEMKAEGPLLHYDLPFEPRPIKATVKGL